MKPPTLPVVAAIPNYNMAKGLARLIPQLLKQGYDHIYVLDDASTDDSKELCDSWGSKLTFIQAKENKGAGAARNLILGRLPQVSLIHFLDADVTVKTSDIPAKIRRLGIDDTTGFIGTQVVNDKGQQSVWNYGARQSIADSLLSWLIYQFDRHGRPASIKWFFWLLPSHPNPYKRPVRRQTHWVLEGSFVIRSDTFEHLGGFDEHIREHDIRPLALKAEKAGLKVYFDPSITVIEGTDLNVRDYNRDRARIAAEHYIVTTYEGRLRWWLPFLK